VSTAGIPLLLFTAKKRGSDIMSATFISEERHMLPREKLILVYWGSDVGAPPLFGVTESVYKLLGTYKKALGAYLAVSRDAVSEKRKVMLELLFALNRLRSEARKDPMHVDWYSELFQTACFTIGSDPLTTVQCLNACRELDRLL
jgi:hypothetical protein